MAPSEVYDRSKIEIYEADLTLVLHTFPFIRTSCGEDTIVKIFFQNLQQPYIATAMLRLDIKLIEVAFVQLHQY